VILASAGALAAFQLNWVMRKGKQSKGSAVDIPVGTENDGV
jgi:hypothetical protein